MSATTVELFSTSLAKARYDECQSILRIHFRDGAVYSYSAVPRLVFEAFLTAQSKGSFFNHNIRNQFPCGKISDEN